MEQNSVCSLSGERESGFSTLNLKSRRMAQILDSIQHTNVNLCDPASTHDEL